MHLAPALENVLKSLMGGGGDLEASSKNYSTRCIRSRPKSSQKDKELFRHKNCRASGNLHSQVPCRFLKLMYVHYCRAIIYVLLTRPWWWTLRVPECGLSQFWASCNLCSQKLLLVFLVEIPLEDDCPAEGESELLGALFWAESEFKIKIQEWFGEGEEISLEIKEDS